MAAIDNPALWARTQAWLDAEITKGLVKVRISAAPGAPTQEVLEELLSAEEAMAATNLSSGSNHAFT